MKTTSTKNAPIKAEVLLKAFDKEFKTILEDDIRKLHLAKDRRIKQAAFLQFIAA